MIPISFDPKKDAINRIKHGISLQRTVDFDMDSAWINVDDSQDYGGVRYVGTGRLHGALYAMTFIVESDWFRIINLRRAKPTERKHYAENT